LTFLVICRVGCCLMLMPGFGSPRVPARIRVWIAFFVAVSLVPVVLPTSQYNRTTPGLGIAVEQIVIEALIGTVVGLLGRMFFSALQFIAAAVASFVGYGGSADMPIEDTEPNAALAHLLTLTATVLFFAGELHWEVLRGLINFYEILPLGGKEWDGLGLDLLSEAISGSFFLVLRISGPFIVYAVVLNFAFGLVNKLTPQIPVYFVCLPFVIFGGLLLLYFAVGDFLNVFQNGMATWLQLI